MSDKDKMDAAITSIGATAEVVSVFYKALINNGMDNSAATFLAAKLLDNLTIPKGGNKDE